jgi:hypothetical protein
VCRRCPTKKEIPRDVPAGKCHPDPYSDNRLTVTRDGLQGHESGCKLLKSTMDPATRVYRMRFRCEGEGETTIEESSMQRTMGVILMRHHGRVR